MISVNLPRAYDFLFAVLFIGCFGMSAAHGPHSNILYFIQSIRREVIYKVVVKLLKKDRKSVV